MERHTCKQCGVVYKYCRACVFKPIYYHDDGFCSEECFNKSRQLQKVEPVIVEEPAPVIDVDSSIESVVEPEVQVDDTISKEIPKNHFKWNTRVVK